MSNFHITSFTTAWATVTGSGPSLKIFKSMCSGVNTTLWMISFSTGGISALSTPKGPYVMKIEKNATNKAVGNKKPPNWYNRLLVIMCGSIRHHFITINIPAHPNSENSVTWEWNIYMPGSLKRTSNTDRSACPSVTMSVNVSGFKDVPV